ncbi:unnamed protein product [marine sediment metagenome]|uniref:Uncharacterized protein n=1 Tax=marine sediment metagenome TaxID=412755 RepID=X0X957_9ZZZZ
MAGTMDNLRRIQKDAERNKLEGRKIRITQEGEIGGEEWLYQVITELGIANNFVSVVHVDGHYVLEEGYVTRNGAHSTVCGVAHSPGEAHKRGYEKLKGCAEKIAEERGTQLEDLVPSFEE